MQISARIRDKFMITKKIKILHILNSNSYSGAENVVITIIKNTMDEFDSIYMSPQGDIENILEAENINNYLVKRLTISEIKKAIKIYNPNIIHAHDFRAGALAALTGTQIPIINHLHNNVPWMRKISLYTIAYALLCLRFNKVLTVSKSVFSEFVFGGVFDYKNKIIGNPLDASAIKRKADICKLKEKSDIIFLGRLSEQKQPLFFLEIVKGLCLKQQSLKVEIIGDGKLRSEVDKLVANYNLESNVSVRGFLNNPYGLLANSRVLCMPSKWEGFGLAAFEALSLGIPVVCSGAGGLIEMVDDSCGKICHENMADYINEIDKLLNNYQYLNMKKENALKRAEKMSNLKVYASEIEKMYSELLG